MRFKKYLAAVDNGEYPILAQQLIPSVDDLLCTLQSVQL